MKSAIGQRGRHAGLSTTPFLAANVGGTPARVASMFRRPRTVPHGFSIAFVWLATTGVAIAAPAASKWSLLPQPAEVRLARSGVVKIAALSFSRTKVAMANSAFIAKRSGGGPADSPPAKLLRLCVGETQRDPHPSRCARRC